MLSRIAAAFYPEASGPGRPIRRVSLVRERTDDNSELIEGLWQETLNIGIRSAAAASLANERRERLAVLSPADAHSLLSVAPAEPAIASAIVSGLVEPPKGLRSIAALEHMRNAVALGRAMAGQVIADEAAAPHQASSFVGSWRDACGHALALIYDLELAAPLAHPTLRFEAGPELLAALRSARRGGTPCIDERGHPFIPVWAQKRADMRRDAHIDALLETPSGRWPIIVKDVSAGGFGISQSPALAAGEVVTLVVGGEQLPCRVAWSENRLAGLQLEERLPPTHVLLRRPQASPRDGAGFGQREVSGRGAARDDRRL